MNSLPFRHAAPIRFRWFLLVTGAALFPAFGQFPDAPRENYPPLPVRRAAVLKDFDRDGDGRLNDQEREATRKAWATKTLSRRPERGFFGPPPELLAEFDTNKDGELDETEGRTAGETMGRRFEQMRKDYDLNKNGRLDEDEIATAVKDIDAGKLKGIPKMFVQFAGGRPGGGPGGRPGGPRGGGEPGEETDPAEAIRAADRDGDGRLNAGELETVRAEWARRRAARGSEKPSPGTPVPPAKP